MSRDDLLNLDRRAVLTATAGATLMMAHPALAAAPSPALKPGRGQAFDLGWRFHLGEGAFEAPGVDDSGWRALDLPHDWSIEDLPAQPGEPGRIVGPFDKKVEGGNLSGYAVGGEGWYRKRFRLDDPKPGRVEVLFDGVYMNSDVWLNGHHLGAHPNGYTPFAYDLTPYLSASGDNLLAVRVRNLGHNARWYSGSGIYRHVWLDVSPEPARVARWGVSVTTPTVSATEASVQIDTRLEDAAGLTLVSRVKDARGRTVWEDQAPAQAQVRQTFTLPAPKLWSPEAPNLYAVETELRRGRSVLDRVETPFGVRVVTFDATRGMTLNGQPVKLRGGCIHHDNGILGAAAFDAAEERKVALLKARGYNAVRPSHNLFSPAFLQACDRQGMMVICEAFDIWSVKKFSPQDFSAFFESHWRSDLAAMVLSARNHPSVIMWSIGNEIPGRNSPKGVETQWRLANEVRRLDPTRPVTAAVNGFPGRVVTPSATAARAGTAGVPDRTSTVFLDTVGYNYKLADYEADHAQFPRVFYGSESFAKDVFAIWDLTERTPWLIGDFIWTAQDYLGEVGIGGSALVPAAAANYPVPFGVWPWINAYCGDIDLIGAQKAPSLARDVVWGVSPLEIAVQRPVPEGKVEVLRFWGWSDELPSWTWPGAEGQPLKVRIYTAGDRVELRLNGRTVESRPVTAADQKHVELKVPYAPGVLEVAAFRNGAEIGRRRLETAGAPAAVRLTQERFGGGAGRGDLSFVALEVVDAQGRRVPDLRQELQLSVSGPGQLVAFGSADPQAVGSLQSTKAKTWDGRALAVVRGGGRPGRVTVTAQGAGLQGATATLRLG